MVVEAAANTAIAAVKSLGPATIALLIILSIFSVAFPISLLTCLIHANWNYRSAEKERMLKRFLDYGKFLTDQEIDEFYMHQGPYPLIVSKPNPQNSNSGATVNSSATAKQSSI
ncbi:MAG: hypothetical protein MHMPM18_000131 [Marteilia pararefringens]